MAKLSRKEYLLEKSKSAATSKRVTAYKKKHPQAWANFLKERGLI
jgi:hypothetical protein